MAKIGNLVLLALGFFVYLVLSGVDMAPVYESLAGLNPFQNGSRWERQQITDPMTDTAEVRYHNAFYVSGLDRAVVTCAKGTTTLTLSTRIPPLLSTLRGVAIEIRKGNGKILPELAKYPGDGSMVIEFARQVLSTTETTLVRIPLVNGSPLLVELPPVPFGSADSGICASGELSV